MHFHWADLGHAGLPGGQRAFWGRPAREGHSRLAAINPCLQKRGTDISPKLRSQGSTRWDAVDIPSHDLCSDPPGAAGAIWGTNAACGPFKASEACALCPLLLHCHPCSPIPMSPSAPQPSGHLVPSFLPYLSSYSLVCATPPSFTPPLLNCRSPILPSLLAVTALTPFFPSPRRTFSSRVMAGVSVVLMLPAPSLPDGRRLSPARPLVVEDGPWPMVAAGADMRLP